MIVEIADKQDNQLLYLIKCSKERIRNLYFISSERIETKTAYDRHLIGSRKKFKHSLIYYKTITSMTSRKQCNLKCDTVRSVAKLAQIMNNLYAAHSLLKQILISTTLCKATLKLNLYLSFKNVSLNKLSANCENFLSFYEAKRKF